MRIPSGRIWLIVVAASAAAMALSAVAVALSVSSGNAALAVISALSLGLFTACVVAAWIIMIKTSKAEAIEEEVKCLKLKKAGIERHCEEIVPKGKMPNE